MDPLSEHPFGKGGLVARHYRLPNRLDVVLVRDPAAPIVAYQTWFRVGSRNERPGKTGMAHLFEHLMFNETEHLAPGEFDRKLESVGADTNAATWVDWTYYKENVPRQHLELVMTLEADRMAHLVVHTPQVDSEREVVASERRLSVEDDVDGFLDEKLHELAFTTHPYHWPTIGWMADILAFTVEDARAFYRTYYAPNNATVVLVGDFDEQHALARLAFHYGGIAPSELPADDIAPEPLQTAERRARFTKEVASERLLVGWHGCPLDHDDHAALSLAVEILCGGASSRVYRKLVVETEVASSVDLSAPHFRDPGLIELRAALQRGQRAEAAEEILYREVAALAATPPDLAELDKAKSCLEADHFRALRHPEGKARSLGHYATTVGDYRRLFDVAERVRRVTAEEVSQVVRRYFDETRRTVVIGEPAAKRGARPGGGKKGKKAATATATARAGTVARARGASAPARGDW